MKNTDKFLVSKIREGMIYIVSDEYMSNSKHNPIILLDDGRKIKDNRIRGVRPYLIIGSFRNGTMFNAAPINSYKGGDAESEDNRYYILTNPSGGGKRWVISSINLDQLQSINKEQLHTDGFVGSISDMAMDDVRDIIKNNVYGKYSDNISYDNNLSSILSYIKENNIVVDYCEDINKKEITRVEKMNNQVVNGTPINTEKENTKLRVENKATLSAPIVIPTTNTNTHYPLSKRKIKSATDRFIERTKKTEEIRRKNEDACKTKILDDIKNGLTTADMAKKYSLSPDVIYGIKKSVLEKESIRKEEEAKRLKESKAKQLENTDSKFNVDKNGVVRKSHTTRRLARLSREEKDELFNIITDANTNNTKLVHSDLCIKFGNISINALQKCIKTPSYIYNVKR